MFKYTQILEDNKELLSYLNDQDIYNIGIISNITINQSKEICEYVIRKEKIKANVEIGNYDNIVQDSQRFNSFNSVVIFWEIYNLIDGLEYKIEALSDEEVVNLILKVKTEIDFVLSNLENVPLVIMNKFSSFVFEQSSFNNTQLKRVATDLNSYLLEMSEQYINLKLVDIDHILFKLSFKDAIDLRYYFSSKALYTGKFFYEYFQSIKYLFLATCGNVKKALILDCDNTLWKGILGEDGYNNIKMFHHIQHLIVSLAQKGIIIGLCSKNNFEDVQEVLDTHKDLILKEEFIVIKKINWIDKAENIQSIATELNIGLDSIVFIDDSDFEINLINETLPVVTTYQVPKKEYDYLLLFKGIMNLFYNPTITKEDIKKVQMYKSQIKRKEVEQSVSNIDDYLKILNLKLTVYIDNKLHIQRVAQMTQKTNQFNLTTKRYTEIEILGFMDSDTVDVISINVEDKFGDNGITALLILKQLDKDTYEIDTCLMSCRVIGRNIEFVIFDFIVNYLKNKNIKNCKAKYLKTMKNTQVKSFYDNIGFQVENKIQDERIDYNLELKNFRTKEIDYIRMEIGK